MIRSAWIILQFKVALLAAYIIGCGLIILATPILVAKVIATPSAWRTILQTLDLVAMCEATRAHQREALMPYLEERGYDEAAAKRLQEWL